MTILSGTAGPDYINGTADDDQIEALAGDDQVFALAGNDTVSGGADNDELYGNAGNDKIDGGAGIDALDGGAGNDDLTGGAGIDFIGGADGTDTAHGGTGTDTIGGGAGNDRLFGEAGADILHGEAGNDSLYGGSGDDNLLGGAGNDNLYGDPGQDLLSGGLGTDNLYGGDGPDTLDGGVGDNLYGEAGDDVLNWNSEQIVLGPIEGGQDSLASGGDGYDTLRIKSDLLFYKSYDGELGPFVSDVNVYHSIYGGGDTFIKLGDHTPEDAPGLAIDLKSIERIEVSGLNPLDYVNNANLDDTNPTPLNITVVGGDKDDHLSGGYGDEVLIGGAGNDVIGGGIGTDRLEGGIGQDTLRMGKDNDTAIGGPDADVFSDTFNPNLPLGDNQHASGIAGNIVIYGVIVDFSVGERDVVQLDATTDLTQVEANGISGDANEILVTQTADAALLTFGGNGVSLQFDTFGSDDIGVINGNTLQALESKLIGISGDVAYDPFQFV